VACWGRSARGFARGSRREVKARRQKKDSFEDLLVAAFVVPRVEWLVRRSQREDG
jgi:hypothetical protein